ncbi:MAG: hypothetical protein RBQ97_08200 [Acholeplasma sp.]|jgi:hypothetical protein|nr:hypothetical protein [Acholeplasma sp.]
MDGIFFENLKFVIEKIRNEGQKKMNKIEIVNDIYHEYYFNEIVSGQTFNFQLDTDRIYLIENINEMDTLSRNQIIKKVKHRFFSMLNDDDPTASEKYTLNITHPLYISLQRCLILFEVKKLMPEVDFVLDFKDFSIISHVIIFRILLYNSFFIHSVKKDIDSYDEDFKTIFSKSELSNWFTIEELISINNNISREKYQIFLDMFSVEICKISSKIDPFKIIKNGDQYTVIFLRDFTYSIYQVLEDFLIAESKKSMNSNFNYGNVKGEMFEKYTKMILRDYIPVKNIHEKCFYRDIDKKDSELDFLIEFEDVLLNIECKSSKFDTYYSVNKQSLNDRFMSAYKRSYESIDRFHRTIKNKDIFSLKTYNKNKIISTKNKKIVSIHLTAYDMRYIGSEIQRDIISDLPKYEFYPININCIDLQCMLMEIRFGSVGDTNFRHYLKKRFDLINNAKNLKFDLDEIDVFGYLISNDETNKKTLDIISEYGEKGSQIDFSISNGIYRKKINEETSTMFINSRIHDFVEDKNQKSIERIFGLIE